MPAFYVSDLDGTLLTNKATLSDYSRAELNKLLADGVAFTVASARSVVAIGAILDGVSMTLPVIEFNGAYISDLATGRHRVINHIDGHVAGEAYETIRKDGHIPLISTYNGREDRLYHSRITNAGTRWYVDDRKRNGDKRLRKTADVPAALKEQVVCITTIATRDALEPLALELERRLADRVEIHLIENRYSPGWHWLTVHDIRASKDQAVRTLMEMEGLSDSDLVVFGDGINDLKLFGIASQSVAVANAPPDVRDRATHVIGTNEQDSVVRFIREHRSMAAAEHP